MQNSSESVAGGGIYLRLRLRKMVVQRVTMVKFGMDNTDCGGIGCFIKVRTDTTEDLESGEI